LGTSRGSLLSFRRVWKRVIRSGAAVLSFHEVSRKSGEASVSA
jgi:hypothetical protein